jgi:SAM-dependent methyltransferase
MSEAIRLLPRDLLVTTGPVDKAIWNYHPVLRWIQRTRFVLICDLMDSLQRGTVLELGYGSGVFMPELARRSTQLLGVDIHPFPAEVTQRLQAIGVEATLYQASAEVMPIPSASVDTVVSVSALEYVPDSNRACQEVARVLRPGGHFVLVTPGYGPAIDLALKLLTNEDADQYGGRRERLTGVLAAHFALDASLPFPPLLPRALRLYSAMRLRNPGRLGTPDGAAVGRQSGELHA